MASKDRLRAIAVGGTCALLGLIAGCGSDSGLSAPAATKTSPTNAETTGAGTAGAETTTRAASSAAESSSDAASSSKDCTWIRADDVTGAVGQPMKLTVAGEAACMFEAVSDGGPTLSLWVTQIAIDQKEYEKGSKEACDNVKEVTADGAAWTCEALGDPQGSIIKDKYIVTLDPKDFANDDDAYAALEKLLKKVTIP